MYKIKSLCFTIICNIFEPFHTSYGHTVQMQDIVELKTCAFLTSALDGGGMSALHFGHFTPKEIVPSTHPFG
jgi:hypothetical protein